jgi:hypothetical protein
MLSKLVANKNQNLLNLSTRAFRASAVANKKPSIGDAVTILQSKVSGINQVVSIFSSRIAVLDQTYWVLMNQSGYE